MSLQKQLKDLKRQKKEQARILHRTYVHTKRDMTRAISPDRLIRRHMGVSLGLAAVAGLILAPAPGAGAKAVKSPGNEPRTGKRSASRATSWLKMILKKVAPQAAKYLPDLDGEASAASPEKNAHGPEEHREGKTEKNRKQASEVRSLIAPMLIELATVIFKKIDLQKLITDLTGKFHKRRSSSERDEEHSGEPHISVADAGAIHDPPAD